MKYAPEGIVREGLQEMRRPIEARYPNDFSMQKTLVENQVESYAALKTYAPKGVPADVLSRIKQKIAARYPNDHSMQKTLIENEVKGYLELKQ